MKWILALFVTGKKESFVSDWIFKTNEIPNNYRRDVIPTSPLKSGFGQDSLNYITRLRLSLVGLKSTNIIMSIVQNRRICLVIFRVTFRVKLTQFGNFCSNMKCVFYDPEKTNFLFISRVPWSKSLFLFL